MKTIIVKIKQTLNELKILKKTVKNFFPDSYPISPNRLNKKLENINKIKKVIVKFTKDKFIKLLSELSLGLKI